MNIRNSIVALVLIVVVAGGFLAFTVLRTPEEASAPITAIPLATTVSSASASSTAESVTASATPSASSSASAAATAEAEASASAGSASTAGSAGVILAQIVPDESEVRFVIDEVLNNAPKTVIGTTNQVAGELSVDPQNLSATQIGTIQINARTLTTDSEFRNRAIKNQILATDQYEFITFTPTAIEGLPASGAAGQSYTFKVTGDLTIRDVTRPVTFDVTATPESDARLTGTATATIRYADYGITIPQVRQVASVAEDVRLEIDFVAVPK